MIIYRIKSKVLKAEGHKFESTDRRTAEGKLAQVRVRDPQAKLLKIEGSR